MTQAYGHRFVSNFGEKDNGVWFEALRDLTPEDLTYGFRKLMRSRSDVEYATHSVWPPNLKEFRLYCLRQYKDFGLPTPAKAFKEAENNRYGSRAIWSHPLVQRISQEVNFFSNDERLDIVYKRFVELYEIVAMQFMRGEMLLKEDA